MCCTVCCPLYVFGCRLTTSFIDSTSQTRKEQTLRQTFFFFTSNNSRSVTFKDDTFSRTTKVLLSRHHQCHEWMNEWMNSDHNILFNNTHWRFRAAVWCVCVCGFKGTVGRMVFFSQILSIENSIITRQHNVTTSWSEWHRHTCMSGALCLQPHHGNRGATALNQLTG